MNAKVLIACFLSLSLLSQELMSKPTCQADEDIIELFLDQINPQDFTSLFYIKHKGSTGLAYLAAFYGRDDILALAHQNEADLSFQFLQDSCIKAAARRGHTACVEYLLKNGVSVTTPDYYQPIHEAASNGHTDVIKVLIRYGADINTFDEDGTPLMFAAGNGHLETVKELLKLGAKVDKKNRRLETAWSYANRAGYKEIVAELEKKSLQN